METKFVSWKQVNPCNNKTTTYKKCISESNPSGDEMTALTAVVI